MKHIYMIGNAHIDPVWFWTWQDGYQEVKATFRSALDRMNENPDFVFTCACADYYRWVEENDPGMFEEIRIRVKEGRWAIVGGMWIQPDMNAPSGESMARHLLYSQRYFKDRFGITATVAYNVDSFGHNAMMPQLFRRAGIGAYVWMRPMMPENNRIPEGASLWQGIDGSSLPTWRILEGYGAFHNVPAKIDQTFDFSDRTAMPAMCFYGVGNHGGGPTIENLREIDGYMTGAPRGSEVRYASPMEYFAAIDPATLPVWKGELQHHASGCYSTHSASKLKHRAAENALQRMEKLSVLSGVLTNHRPNAPFVQQAWQNLLFNEFHDIMGGCSAEDVLDTVVVQLDEAISIAAREENAALQKISWKVDTSKGLPPVHSKEEDWQLWGIRGMGTPVVVFNPHEFPAEGPVHIRRPIRAVRDDSGAVIPVQQIRAGRTNGDDKWDSTFLAQVPPLGYRLYWIFLEDAGDAPANPLSVSESHIENARIRAEFDPATGSLIALIDKSTGENLLRAPSAARLIDIEHCDTWAHMVFTFDKPAGEFTLDHISVTETGPVRASVKVVLRHGNSVLEQTYTLYADADQLEISNRLRLDERHRLVKLCWPTIHTNGTEFSEISCGAIERTACGEEEHCQRWIAMQGENSGLAVLNNGKYSYSAKDGELRLTVANTSIFADHYGQPTRDEHCRFMDQNEQAFTVILAPFADSWQDARLHQRAALLNQPLPHVTETYHAGPLPTQFSGISIDCPHIQLLAFKPAESGDGHILRLVEATGRPQQAKIALPLLNREFALEFSPYQIHTIHLPADPELPPKEVLITELDA